MILHVSGVGAHRSSVIQLQALAIVCTDRVPSVGKARYRVVCRTPDKPSQL